MTVPASPPLTPEERADLARKQAAASPGTWVAQRMEDGRWLVRTEDGGLPYSVAEIPQSRPGYTSPRDRADAVFIAAAHEMLPRLLLAAERAEGLARALEYALSDEGGFACPTETEDRLRAAVAAYRGSAGDRSP